MHARRIPTVSLLAGLLCSTTASLSPAAAQELRVAPKNPDWVAWNQAPGRGFQSRPDAAAPGEAFGDEPTLVDFSYLADSCSDATARAARDLPSRFDPREKQLTSGVRNQGAFGTCWAHASIASIETWLVQHRDIREDLSEANLVKWWGFDSDGRNGGSAPKAAAYLLRGEGPVAEADDPYPQGLYNPQRAPLPIRHLVRQYRIVPGKNAPLAHDHVKQAILEFGGLYTSFHLVQSSPYLDPERGTYYPKNSSSSHSFARRCACTRGKTFSPPSLNG